MLPDATMIAKMAGEAADSGWDNYCVVTGHPQGSIVELTIVE